MGGTVSPMSSPLLPSPLRRVQVKAVQPKEEYLSLEHLASLFPQSLFAVVRPSPSLTHNQPVHSPGTSGSPTSLRASPSQAGTTEAPPPCGRSNYQGLGSQVCFCLCFWFKAASKKYTCACTHIHTHLHLHSHTLTYTYNHAYTHMHTLIHLHSLMHILI